MENIDLYDFQDEQTLRAIEGGYDLHVHCAPDYYPRGFDDFELVREMDQLGMAGAVPKCHQAETATRAWLTNKYAGAQAQLFGSICMNDYVGGLNPVALEAAIGLGIKYVWMPTKHAQNEQDHLPENMRTHGIRILDENGALLPVVHDLLDLIGQHDLTVGTGHMATDECVAFCKEARRRGIRTVLTHPESPTIKHPMAVQKMLAELGVFIEEEYIINVECQPLVKRDVDRPDLDMNFNMSIAKAAAYIREIGVEHCLLVSDAALPDYPSSSASIYAFAKGLIYAEGFTVDEVQTLTRRVPEQVLGI